MTRISTAEFIKNYGTLADKALQEPLTITKNGRDRLVLLNAAEFERLKRRDRRVLRIEDWTTEEIAVMEEQLSLAARDGDPELDKELQGWTP